MIKKPKNNFSYSNLKNAVSTNHGIVITQIKKGTNNKPTNFRTGTSTLTPKALN